MVIDDHEVMRLGIAHVIRTHHGWELGGEASDVTTALKLIQDVRPHLAIIDLRLGYGDGLELIKSIRVTAPSCRMLVLSSLDEDLFAERALRAGANGFISKQEPLPTLLGAITKVLDGGIYLSSAMTDRVLKVRAAGMAAEQSPLTSLSDREMGVFELLGQGKSVKEIAAELRLSPKTIEYHRQNIKDKLQLSGSAAVVRQATAYVLGKADDQAEAPK